MYFINIFAPNHLLLILLIVVLLFGAKKIPDLMRGIGKGMREFKDARNTAKVDNDDALTDRNTPASTTNKTTIQP